MTYAGSVILAVLAVLSSTVALPNHLKAVALDAVPVIQGTSVSASFGGYSAKAGLGGSVEGGPAGGLYAAAESPLGSAGAGLGGTVGGQKPIADKGSAGSYAGGDHAAAPPPHAYPAGHKPGPQGPTAFDSIFNIPISVLQAVNTYLNNRGPVTKPMHRRRGHRHRQGQGEEEVVYKTVTPVRGETPGVENPAGTPAENIPAAAPVAAGPLPAAVDAQGHAVVHKRVNYDNIFNIPISALKSVNDLLNG